MKIRQRLALRFTLVSALIIGTILIFIYILTRGFVHADFQERLTQQSRLEVLHYATPQVKEVLPPGAFFLVNPETSIYSSEGKLLYKQGNYPIPADWLAALQKSQTFNNELNEYTTVGRRYEINGVTYFVFVSDKDLPGQHELDILVKTILAGWMVSLVFSYMAGLYFSANALQPVKRVVEEVKHITQDNLGHRLTPANVATHADEIDELILTFNALLTRIENAFIIQKRFVQHASHELKTPLTAIMAEADLGLARDRSASEYRRTLQVITQETERLVTITHGLLMLARMEEGSQQLQITSLNLSDVLESTLTAFKKHHPQREVRLVNRLADTRVMGNKQLLEIALINILDNAVKYSNDVIILTAEKISRKVSLSIIDNGIGIPGQELNKIRMPLYRASNAKDVQGAGLGLSLVERIIKVHDGDMTISSEVGSGTICTITLPIELD